LFENRIRPIARSFFETDDDDVDANNNTASLASPLHPSVVSAARPSVRFVLKRERERERERQKDAQFL